MCPSWTATSETCWPSTMPTKTSQALSFICPILYLLSIIIYPVPNPTPNVLSKPTHNLSLIMTYPLSQPNSDNRGLEEWLVKTKVDAPPSEPEFEKFGMSFRYVSRIAVHLFSFVLNVYHHHHHHHHHP